jgi:V8-like Glu-specific endopeptidase
MATPITERRIVDAARPPYSAVGILLMHFTDGEWYTGTGALIDQYNVLTCAHNLVDPAPKTARADIVRFFRAWNTPGNPNSFTTGYLEVDCSFYPTKFQQGDKLWDVGMVRLKSPVDKKDCPFFFTPFPVNDNSLRDSEVFINIVGYPGNHKGEMWEDLDQVTGLFFKENVMVYTHTSMPGSSGSPVFKYNAVSDVIYQYAIHVRGWIPLEPDTDKLLYEFRQGTLITDPVYKWIESARRSGC